MQLVSQRVIRPRHAHKFREFGFDGSVLLTQYLNLPLNERNGRATSRMGQTKLRQHRMMTFEEIGIVLQIGGNRFFFCFYGCYAARFSCCHICQTST